MKDFLKYYYLNKDPYFHFIPEVATAIVLIFSVVGLLITFPVFTLIVAMTALVWYWAKMFEDYKSSKEKKDE